MKLCGKHLHDLMTTLGVVNAPGWFKNINLLFWPMPHQLETMRQYPHNLRYGDFSEPGTGKTFPAHAHGILMAGLSSENKVIYVMPPRLIGQFYNEMLNCFQGIEKRLWIEQLGIDGKMRDTLIDSWRKDGKSPDILIMSYEMFRKYNSRESRVNFNPASCKKDEQGILRTKHGDAVEIVPARTSDGTLIKGKVSHRAENPYHLLLFRMGYRIMFFDEAHTNLCNSSNIAWKTCEYIDKTCADDAAMYLMTGTPIPTKIENCYGIVKLVNPEAYRNKTAFLRRHVQYDRSAQFPKVVGYHNLPELKANLYKNARRVEKREVTPLAVPTVQVHSVKLAGKHRTLYRTYLKDRYAVVDDTVLSADSDQQLIQDAHQLISVPEKFDPKGAEGAIAKDNELRKTLNTLLDSIDLSQHKVLVFAKYTSTVAALAEHLKEFNPAVLNGKTRDGNAEVQKFKEDDTCRVFVLNWTSGGAGLNLQSNCSTVIYYESPTSPKDAEQAMGRVDRTGQKEQVNLHFLYVKGTYAGRSLESLVENGTTNNIVIGDVNPLIYEKIKGGLK